MRQGLMIGTIALALTGGVWGMEAATQPAESDEVKSVLDRWEKRYGEGFGNFVAVETTSDLGNDGKAEAGGQMWVYARNGKAWGAKEYLFGDRTDRNGIVTAHRPDPPKGWPTPAWVDVAAAVKEMKPALYVVSDGEKTVGDMGDGKEIEIKNEVTARFRVQFSLEGRLWRTRLGIGGLGPGGMMEAVHDEAGHGGLMGLKMQQMVTVDVQKGTLRKDTKTYWVDGAHDDLIAEQTVESAGRNVRNVVTDWATTADKKWYPAAWKMETAMRGVKTGAQYHLQVWTETGVEAGWFKGQ